MAKLWIWTQSYRCSGLSWVHWCRTHGLCFHFCRTEIGFMAGNSAQDLPWQQCPAVSCSGGVVLLRDKIRKKPETLIRMGRRLFLSISFSVPLPCYVLMNPKTLTTIFSLSKEIFVQKIHLGLSLLFLGSEWGFKTESVIFLLHNIRDWRLLSLQTETMHILYIKIFCQTCPEKCWFWSIMTKSYHFQ